MFGIRYGFARRGISWPALHVVPASRASEVRETLSHVSRSTTLRTTPHSAHRDREDGLRTPVGVLTWDRGAEVGWEALQRHNAFTSTRSEGTRGGACRSGSAGVLGA